MTPLGPETLVFHNVMLMRIILCILGFLSLSGEIERGERGEMTLTTLMPKDISRNGLSTPVITTKVPLPTHLLRYV